MAATVDNKSDVSRQLGDDQENELLTAEEKEHSPTDPEKKEEVVEIEKDGSNLPEKTNHPLGTSCKVFPLHSWLYMLPRHPAPHLWHSSHHLRQLEQHRLLFPLCHPQLPLAQVQTLYLVYAIIVYHKLAPSW